MTNKGLKYKDRHTDRRAVYRWLKANGFDAVKYLIFGKRVKKTKK